MGRNQKFSKEVKIEACENYKKGYGSFRSLAKNLGCNRETMRRWYMTYINHGASAFNTLSNNKSYSKSFKMSVVTSYLSGEYSLADLSAKYNISLGVVLGWINKYNNGIELEDYDPKGEVYTMKSRKTTFEERLKIVKWVIANNMNYKTAASNYMMSYALVYKWTKSYLKDGEEGLKYKKRGPKAKKSVDESGLSEIDKLRQELEREKALRKKREFEIEVLKKKEEYEKKNRFRK